MLPEIRVEILCDVIKLSVKHVLVETDTLVKYYLMGEILRIKFLVTLILFSPMYYITSFKPVLKICVQLILIYNLRE
jgi:formate hydrogenlyase subunit 4